MLYLYVYAHIVSYYRSLLWLAVNLLCFTILLLLFIFSAVEKIENRQAGAEFGDG